MCMCLDTFTCVLLIQRKLHSFSAFPKTIYLPNYVFQMGWLPNSHGTLCSDFINFVFYLKKEKKKAYLDKLRGGLILLMLSPNYLMSQMSSQKHNITCWIISPQTITNITNNCWNHTIIALNSRQEIHYIRLGLKQDEKYNLLIFQVSAFSYLNDPTGKTFPTFWFVAYIVKHSL